MWVLLKAPTIWRTKSCKRARQSVSEERVVDAVAVGLVALSALKPAVVALEEDVVGTYHVASVDPTSIQPPLVLM